MKNKKLAKLNTLIAAQEMSQEILDDLFPRLTEESSDEDFMVYGTYQQTILTLERQIRHIRNELSLPQERFKILYK